MSSQYQNCINAIRVRLLWHRCSKPYCHGAVKRIILSGRVCRSAVMDFCRNSNNCTATVPLQISAILPQCCYSAGIQVYSTKPRGNSSILIWSSLGGSTAFWKTGFLANSLIAALIQQCTTHIVHYIHSTLRYYIIMYVIHARVCDHNT